jgi:hypothetical protein
MAAPLPVWVAVGTGLITIILAIPLHALLALDFTCTILRAFAFHLQFSFPKDYTTSSIVVHFLLYAIPLDDMKELVVIQANAQYAVNLSFSLPALLVSKRLQQSHGVGFRAALLRRSFLGSFLSYWAPYEDVLAQAVAFPLDKPAFKMPIKRVDCKIPEPIDDER